MNQDFDPIAAPPAAGFGGAGKPAPGPAADPSPVAWLHGEIGRSLESAHKLLRQFLRERDSHAGSDVSAHESRGARNARTMIHQCAGALRLADADAPARLLEAADAALGNALERQARLDAALVEKIEQGSFAVVDFLGRQLADKPVSPLQLFPQLRALLEAGSAERVHPADLWPHAWQWRGWPLDATVVPRAADARSLTAFEQLTLANIKTPSPLILVRLSDLCAALAGGAAQQGDARVRTLWQLAAAVFEALASELLPADVFSKRLASRLLALLRSAQRGDGRIDDDAMQRLAHDLLFFCAQSQAPDAARPAPRLGAARLAHGLVDAVPIDYTTSTLGRFDPAQLVQARKRVQGAKQAWSSVAAGEPHHLASLGEPFALVADSLALLFDDGERLGSQLQAAADEVRRSSAEPAPALAIEVATALLYVEAALEDLDAALQEPVHPVTRLAERIQAVRAGAASRPIEDWITDLYARIADRQMLGTVVQELRGSMAAAEQALDRYFRDPADRGALRPVGGLLQSMRGVLSVLGVGSAADALHALQFEIDALAAGAPGEPGQLERIAGNLGTLGFQIDLFGVQPALARSMFHFEPMRGVLESQLGQVGHTAGDPAIATALADLHLTVTAPLEAAELPAGSMHPLPEPRLIGSAADAEVLDIFTEEAGQLLLQAQDALAEWRSGVDATGPLARLRRIFHTIKGSARMVGEAVFGAAAWQAEERIAARLALAGDPDAGPAADGADQILADWTGQALDRFSAALGQATAAVPFERAPESSGPIGRPADSAQPTASAADGSTGFDLDLDLDLDFDLGGDFAARPVGPHPVAPIENGAAGAPGLDLDFDLGPDPAAAQPHPESPVSSAAQPTGSADLDFDLDLDLDPSEPPQAAASVLGFPTDLPSASDLDLDFGLAPERPPRQPAADQAAAPPPEEEAPALPEVEQLLFEPLPPDAPRLGGVTEQPDLSFLRFDLADAPDAAAPAQPALMPPAQHDVPAPPFELPDRVDDSAPQPLVEPESEQAPAPQWEPELEPEIEPQWEPEPAPELQPQPQPQPGLTSIPGIDLGLDAVVDSSEAPLPESAAASLRQVGELSIPNELFNIFLNEADDLSRQLCTALHDWSAQPWQPLPDAAVGRAHSLAGSSATVGFDALSELAHELESGLLREQQLARRGIGGAAEDARLFCDAAEELRGLLHQFAAGFLRLPSAELRERLRQQRDATLHQLQQSDARETVQPADGVDTDWQPAASTQWQPLGMTLPQPLEAELPAAAPPLESSVAPAPAVPDRVDPELFPVFEEEAQDLLPKLAAALRAFARGRDRTAADEAMRHLHTFKGGARLAGALQLGDIAHQLESRIEAVAAGLHDAAAGECDALLADADALQHAFEQLREADRRAYAEADAKALARTAAERSGNAIAAPAGPAAPLAPIVVPAAVPADVSTPLPAGPMPPFQPRFDWSRFAQPVAAALLQPARAGTASAQASVKVRAAQLDRMVDQAGEVNMSRARVEVEMIPLRGAIAELGEDVERLRQQLHEMELQAELQLASGAESSTAQRFDPLEIDRFTRLHELTRMMAESVADVAAVQRSLKRNLQRAEDELATQTRLTRDLQADLLRTRLVEFDTIAERLHRVARQAAGEAGKLMQLQIIGGSIELDRGVLERLTPAFEHLLRNAAVHGIEYPVHRRDIGKPEMGSVVLQLHQHGNQISIELRDDGTGLDLARIRDRAFALGRNWIEGQESELIFSPGFSTAGELTESAGRGVGLDVVRNEVLAVDGQIEVSSVPGAGCRFVLELPLTTAMTQVLMLRCGELSVAVPATLVEHVRRIDADWLAAARADGYYLYGDLHLPLHWLGALLQHSAASSEEFGHSRPLVIVHAGRQRVALLVDEVLGQHEAIVRPLGAQLARVPGLAGMSVLASGAVALIYNPVALAAAHGDAAQRWSMQPPPALVAAPQPPAASLVLVVDDSLTVRRVTQRLLLREGYRVALAKDGIEALERIGEETPRLILSDIEMPRMDGYQLVEALRAEPARAAIPVVMITSRSADKHRAHAESLGVVGYLGKPYGEQELLAIVAGYCAASDRTTA